MEVIRTFHPVGQGAFYSERHIVDRKTDKEYTVVYDCGSSDANIVENEIRSCFDKGQEIAAVFISHLHYDHISGLEYLLKYCNVKKIFMPLLTKCEKFNVLIQNRIIIGSLSIPKFIDDLILNPNSIINQFDTDIVLIPDLSENAVNHESTPVSINNINSVSFKKEKQYKIFIDCFDWIFIPFNFREKNRLTTLLKKLHDVIFPNEKIYSEKIICDYIISIDKFKELWDNEKIRKKIIEVYKKVPGSMNTNSMTLYSGSNKRPYRSYCNQIKLYPKNIEVATRCPAVMYFGDYDAKGKMKWNSFKKYYNIYWEYVCMAQIPHHGSKNNYNKEINYEKPKISLISAGLNSQYGHPHCKTVLDIVIDGGIPIIVTEEKSSRLIFSCRYPKCRRREL